MGSTVGAGAPGSGQAAVPGKLPPRPVRSPVSETLWSTLPPGVGAGIEPASDCGRRSGHRGEDCQGPHRTRQQPAEGHQQKGSRQRGAWAGNRHGGTGGNRSRNGRLILTVFGGIGSGFRPPAGTCSADGGHSDQWAGHQWHPAAGGWCAAHRGWRREAAGWRWTES